MEQFNQAFREAYKAVEWALKEDEMSRNSDKYLLFKVWEMQTGRKKFGVEDVFELMNPSTIFRARRVIQNDELRLLPTFPAVLVERKFREQEVRNYFAGDKVILSKYLETIYGTEGVI